MSGESGQLGTVLHDLRERTKELNCIYQANDLLSSPDRPLAEVLQGIVGLLPPAWQYPDECQAQIVYEDLTLRTPGFAPTAWVQAAGIVVEGKTVGRVEVSYRREMPAADEGPFLKEERKLIETLARRIASHVMHRRLRVALPGLAAAPPHGEAAESKVVLDFLRDTDPVLLRKISRRLINHLSWSGVSEAKRLLDRGVARPSGDSELSEGNRPLGRALPTPASDLTAEAVSLARHHLSEAEILKCLVTWIREEKSGFLVRALEDQDTSLGEILDALERYRRSAGEAGELPSATQRGIRVSLIRRFFSGSRDFIKVAKEFLDVADFYDLLGKIVFPPRCHGKLGGKSAGLFLARKIIEKSPSADPLLRDVKVPKTWYVTSDYILNFIHHNELDDVLSRKYLEIDRVRQEYPHLVALFKKSSFPSELANGLLLALEDFEDAPLIVRSSSLLEDRLGSAFSGKYKSLFLGNQGSKEERLAALMDAVAEVYASIFGPDPTEYRAERGLLDVHEEMGIMIQQVVGQRVGKYFLPACSGVAFSNNEFRWSARIQRNDGLVRLVPGLGTRAVDRLADDYPVLIAPGQPNLRANVTVEEVCRYSPKRVDVINLESNAFETVEAHELLRECGARYPQIQRLVSYVEDNRLVQPIGPVSDAGSRDLVFTFEGLIRQTPFVARLRALLSLLQSTLGTPVDIEFAYDGTDFYLVQCRPQSYSGDAVPAAIPQNLPAEQVVFSANRCVSNGKVPDVTHIVYIDLERYSQLPDLAAMRDVGRAVGLLNKLLPKRQFILIGPGRWGSRGDIKLGVPVTYSDINNTAMLIEVARQRGNYLPELSFGTHFFQDLVEASIRYLPLYPDDPSTMFQESFFLRSRNILQELLPEFAHLADTLRVIDVPRETGGLTLQVLMNADSDQALAFLSPPGQKGGPAGAESPATERAGDDPSQWRLRMAQTIALQIDAPRFGVQACYLLGSTKNGTAGPTSDIDLLLHFGGTETQRAELLLWLEGWGRCLAEVNFLRTGHRPERLLDVYLITDADIAQRSSLAAKIGAITDPARKLPMQEASAG